MRTVLITLLICLVQSAFAQGTPMSKAQGEQFEQELLKSTANTQTLQSDFTQYKHMDLLTNDIVSSGTMSFRSPNTVKWAYTKPYDYSIIFKDGMMKVNDAGRKSEVDIGSHKLLAQVSDMMTKSVRGDLFKDPAFNVSLFSGTKYDVVVLKPKDKVLAGYVKQLELNFAKTDRKIQELKIIEPNEDHTRIVFSGLKINPALGDAVFAH